MNSGHVYQFRILDATGGSYTVLAGLLPIRPFERVEEGPGMRTLKVKISRPALTSLLADEPCQDEMREQLDAAVADSNIPIILPATSNFVKKLGEHMKTFR